MHTSKAIAVVVCAFLQIGCASMTPKEVASPSEISFEDAMTQLGSGFRKMADAQGDLKTGLVASEASVTFNVKASAKDSSKLTLDLSLAPVKPFPKTAKLGGEIGGSSDGERGNTVTVKFVNLLSFANNLTAENAQKIIDVLNNNGYRIFRANDIRLNNLEDLIQERDDD